MKEIELMQHKTNISISRDRDGKKKAQKKKQEKGNERVKHVRDTLR